MGILELTRPFLLQMATNLQLKSALKKTQSGFICSKCLKESTVKKVSFNLKPVYTKLEALERFNRRMITIQQLIEGRHVSTSKLILLLIEIRFTVRALKKKCKKSNYHMVLWSKYNPCETAFRTDWYSSIQELCTTILYL